jgi:hypothetical protein
MPKHDEIYMKDKETKGAVRYSPAVVGEGGRAVDQDSPYGVVYFRKELFSGGPYPDEILVTFEWEAAK